MTNDFKIILGIVGAAMVILVGGIFFFTRQDATSPQKVNQELLVRADSYKTSPDAPKVTLVEFSDFQCPACGAYHPLVKKLMDEFKNDLTFVYRNFPLYQHKNAYKAAVAAEAAGKQGKFWEMHDLLFENQGAWSGQDNPQDKFSEYANFLKLNLDKFKKDMDLAEIKQKIDRDIADGGALGVNSTPTFFLEAEKLKNPASYEEFKTLIQAAISKSPISQKDSQKVHVHANFRVYLNGIVVDLTKAKYQSVEGKELNLDVHLHDANGDVIHIHKKGVGLGTFFKSLGISFTKDCFILDTGQKNCGGNGKSLKFYVNGAANNDYEKYEPKDLDKILISFGPENDVSLQKQISKVPDTACIYSEKCPERGKPPKESCVGGLGTGCE